MSSLNSEQFGRAQAEAALRVSEARTAAILEAALDCIVTIDHQGNVLDWNPAAEKIFGYTRAEAMGKEMAALIVPPALRERHRMGLTHATASGKSTIIGRRIEITAIRSDGTEFPVELAITRISTDGPPMFTGHIRDITARKQAEEEIRRLNRDLEQRIAERTMELRESQEHFTKAFRASPVPVSIARLKDGVFIEVNEAFLQMTGYKRDEVVGHDSAEVQIWSGVEERTKIYCELEQRGYVRNHETNIRAKSGEMRTVLVSAELIEIRHEKHILAVRLDITARKQAEAELQNALERERELSRLKSNFVSLVSHEFRTPLGVIMSSAEILENYIDRLKTEQRKEHLHDIRNASRQMAAMMEEVLFLGRIEAERIESKRDTLDLAALCRRIKDEIQAATTDRCPVELTLKKLPVKARGDENLLRHVLANLLSNAVKYSVAGQQVMFVVERKGDDAVFRVIDHGIGIPKEEHNQLFQTFYRASNVGQRPGTGLGLVLVKKCLDLQGGNLTIDSEEGKGTTVTVRVPLFGKD